MISFTDIVREAYQGACTVPLYQWLHQSMEAVVLMYEDCFDLYVLQTQVINNSDGGDDTQSGSWWRKLTQGKAKAASSSALRYSITSDFSLPVKRTKELNDYSTTLTLSLVLLSLQKCVFF